MRGLRLAFALVGAWILVLTGCTSGSSGSQQQATGTGTTAQHANITDFDYDTFSSAAGKKLISEYEQSHPGVTIQVVHTPPGNLVSYIDTQLAGGTAPDIMTLATDEQTWKDLNKGWWLDLTQYAEAPDPYVPGNKHWIDLLTPGAASQLRFTDGHIYSLTTTGFDVAFFYNKAIFSKLGISVPKTWDQLVADYQKIEAAGYIPLDMELGDTEYADQTEAFITILEGTLMYADIQKMDTNHDGVVDICELVAGIKDGEYSARNADYQAAWTLEKSLAPYLELGAASQTSSDDGFNLFKTGKVATWFEGSFNGPSLAGTGVNWGAFPMPALSSSDSSFATSSTPQSAGAFGACCGYPWAIPMTTAKNGNLKPAIDFLYWLSQPKITDRFAAEGGVLSIERDAASNPSLAGFQYAASHVSPVGVAELTMPPEFMTTRSRLSEEYITGSISLSQAMQQMQAQMNKDASVAATIYKCS